MKHKTKKELGLPLFIKLKIKLEGVLGGESGEGEGD
jgi:hypothetical protein